MSCMRERTSSRGQSLVEMALVLPILALLLIGVFEIGMLLYAHVQVANAAREGARAASLYRSTRYTSITINNSGNPERCDGVDGWSLDRTVQQAIVYRELDNKGCPDDAGAIVYTSLGWLDPAPVPAWAVTVNATLGEGTMPAAGSQGTVTLDYPYHLLILSNLLPSLSDPMTITKSVDFHYQQ